jgi:leucyl aminopeptidase
MEIRAIQTPPAQVEAEVVVVGVFAEGEPAAAVGEIDQASGGLLRRLIDRGEITGKPYETTVLLAPAGVTAEQVLVLGLGPREKFDAGAAFRAAGAAAKRLAGKQRGRVAYFLGEDWPSETRAHALAGAIVGAQGQDLYREKKNLFPPNELLWAGGDEAAIHEGRVLGESVNFTRKLVNTPAEELYPASFAKIAEQLGGEVGLEVEVWDRERLEAERCGALLAVGRASAREPRLVICRYRGGADDAPPLALVGKGVTFDSGGLSLKPSDSMIAMKCDMAGAATVLGALRAIALLKLPVNVVGVMGLVENLVGPASYKLGDVLRTRKGVTIEVHNTDAEGRLVLSDALDVAVEQRPARMIDLATLTGACMVALGTDVAGLMTNNQPWCDRVSEAARKCGELVWQLPMFPEYDELIKSEVADIKNVGKGRWGGAITAAKLLEQFVGDVPWTHIDIAGPAFRDAPKPWCDAGASGELVRALVEVARGE